MITEQGKCVYSPLGEAFEKQAKTIEGQGKEEIEAFKSLKREENQEVESIEGIFLKYMTTNEIKNEWDEIKIWKAKIKRKDVIYKANKCDMIFINMKQ